MLSNMLTIFFIIILLLFGFNNSEIIKINLIPGLYNFEFKTYMVIFTCFLLGFCSAYFFMSKKLIIAKIMAWKKSKKITLLEKQLEEKTTKDHETKNKIMWHQ